MTRALLRADLYHGKDGVTDLVRMYVNAIVFLCVCVWKCRVHLFAPSCVAFCPGTGPQQGWISISLSGGTAATCMLVVSVCNVPL